MGALHTATSTLLPSAPTHPSNPASSPSHVQASSASRPTPSPSPSPTDASSTPLPTYLHLTALLFLSLTLLLFVAGCTARGVNVRRGAAEHDAMLRRRRRAERAWEREWVRRAGERARRGALDGGGTGGESGDSGEGTEGDEDGDEPAGLDARRQAALLPLSRRRGRAPRDEAHELRGLWTPEGSTGDSSGTDGWSSEDEVDGGRSGWSVRQGVGGGRVRV